MLQVKEESEDHSGEKEEVMPEQTGKKRKEHAAQAAQDLQVHHARKGTGSLDRKEILAPVDSGHLSPEFRWQLCLAPPAACSLLRWRVLCQALNTPICKRRAHHCRHRLSHLGHALHMARRMMTQMRPRRRA